MVGSVSDKVSQTGKLTVIGETSDSTDAALDVRDSANNSLFYVRNDGRVGIGVEVPSSTFHFKDGLGDVFINGSAVTINRGAVYFQSANGTNGSVYIRANADDAKMIFINGSTGNVAVGTNLPGVSRLLSKGSTTTSAGNSFEAQDSSGNTLFVVRNDGKIGIGGAPDTYGALDIQSATGALILPRMTTAQRDAMTPKNGMIIYNTSTNQFNFYENSSWVTK
jgi:hypothetical protein